MRCRVSYLFQAIPCLSDSLYFELRDLSSGAEDSQNVFCDSNLILKETFWLGNHLVVRLFGVLGSDFELWDTSRELVVWRHALRFGTPSWIGNADLDVMNSYWKQRPKKTGTSNGLMWGPRDWVVGRRRRWKSLGVRGKGWGGGLAGRASPGFCLMLSREASGMGTLLWYRIEIEVEVVVVIAID